MAERKLLEALAKQIKPKNDGRNMAWPNWLEI